MVRVVRGVNADVDVVQWVNGSLQSLGFFASMSTYVATTTSTVMTVVNGIDVDVDVVESLCLLTA